MSKKPSNPSNNPLVNAPAIPENFHIPEGYTEQTSDIVGFYNPETYNGIHFIPQEAKVFDSQLDAKKTSTLIIGKLVDGALLLQPGDKGPIDARPGDNVGVWYKPGMKDLRQQYGEKTILFQSGEKDTGKPNPMKTFKVMAAKKGSTLYTTEDLRQVSKRNALVFPPSRELSAQLRPEESRVARPDEVDSADLF